MVETATADKVRPAHNPATRLDVVSIQLAEDSSHPERLNAAEDVSFTRIPSQTRAAENPAGHLGRVSPLPHQRGLNRLRGSNRGRDAVNTDRSLRSGGVVVTVTPAEFPRTVLRRFGIAQFAIDPAASPANAICHLPTLLH